MCEVTPHSLAMTREAWQREAETHSVKLPSRAQRCLDPRGQVFQGEADAHRLAHIRTVRPFRFRPHYNRGGVGRGRCTGVARLRHARAEEPHFNNSVTYGRQSTSGIPILTAWKANYNETIMMAVDASKLLVYKNYHQHRQY